MFGSQGYKVTFQFCFGANILKLDSVDRTLSCLLKKCLIDCGWRCACLKIRAVIAVQLIDVDDRSTTGWY